MVVGATREATVGLGCFWAPSEELLGVDGVVDTVCGYAGAAFPDARPSYDSVCGGDGNAEAVRVSYDDEKLTYEDYLGPRGRRPKTEEGAWLFRKIC